MPISSRIRPFSSILCTLHPRPSKPRASSASEAATTTFYCPVQSDDLVTISATVTAAETASLWDSSTLFEAMPIATIEEETPSTPKMHAYARGTSSEPVSNGAPVSAVKVRADTPQVFSRQALADGARLPMPGPKPTRFGSVNHHQISRSNSGPNHSPPTASNGSPPMRRARTNSNDRVGGVATLWAPSVLSESEFNSPSTELDPTRHARYPSTNPMEEVHPALAQQPPWNPHQSSHFSEFIIGSDGMMKVRPLPNEPNRQVETNHHLQLENPFSSSPPHHHQTKLPLREIHSPRLYQDHQHHNNLADEDEIMGAVPSSFEHAHRTIERPQNEPSNRPGTLFADVDNFEVVTEVGQVTPKAPEKKAPKKLLESSLPPFPPPPPKEERGKKRRRNSCDYDDNALSLMNFSELDRQPFDFDPSAEASPPGSRARGGDSLTARLDYYKTKPEADQKDFFTSMPVGDWDRSGDWFLDQFGALVQKMKEHRQHRRAIVDKFEREISQREESVRLKTESINKKLNKMKQNGLKVVSEGIE